MATVVESPVLKKKILYVKGAPEIVLAHSENVRYKNGLKTVSESLAEIEDILQKYQSLV